MTTENQSSNLYNIIIFREKKDQIEILYGDKDFDIHKIRELYKPYFPSTIPFGISTAKIVISYPRSNSGSLVNEYDLQILFIDVENIINLKNYQIK